MKRNEYWTHIADSKLPETGKFRSKEFQKQVEYVVFRFIEKAVALIALNNYYTARDHLWHADKIMIDKKYFDSDYLYYLYRFLLFRLLEKHINFDHDQLLKSKIYNTLDELMKFEIQDIINSFYRGIYSSMDTIEIDDRQYSTEEFKMTSRDFYYYQVLANRQFELARFYLLAGRFIDFSNNLKEAKDNYKNALKKINQALIDENLQWKKLIVLSDEEILEKHPTETQFIEKRKDLIGNIPLFQKQVGILKRVNNNFNRIPGLTWEEKAQLKENICAVFGSKDGVSSNLTLIDELIWIFIMWDLMGTTEKRLNKSDFFDFMREFLI